MSGAIRVRPFERSDLGGVMALFAQYGASHPELQDEKAFLWQQAERFVAVSGTEIVGYATILPQEAIYKNDRFTLGWGATLVVDTTNAIRQTFAGSMLLDQITKKSAYPFAAVGVVPEILPTYPKRGYVVDLNSAAMFAHFRRPAAALAYQGKSALLAPILSTANTLVSATYSSSVSSTTNVYELNLLPDNLEAISSEWLLTKSALATTRDRKFLAYKLSQPGKHYRIYVAPSKEKPEALMIVRSARHPLKPFSVLRVCELLGPDDMRLSLLRKGMQLTKEENLDGVVAVGLASEKALYRRSGLWLARPFPVVHDKRFHGPVRVSFMDSDLEHLW